MLKHTTYGAPARLSDLLLFEIYPDYSRDTLTIYAPSAALEPGCVLMDNGDGTLSPWAAAAEGSDPAAAGILLAHVDVSASNVQAPVLARGALVSGSALIWPADLADAKKAAAIATLKTLGIVVRTIPAYSGNTTSAGSAGDNGSSAVTSGGVSSGGSGGDSGTSSGNVSSGGTSSGGSGGDNGSGGGDVSSGGTSSGGN